MRFTLPKLFLAVTMAALACAGMTMRTRWWADSIISLTSLLYVVAAIAGFQSSGRPRAFRITFAIVGGGYLLVVLSGNLLSSFRDSLLTSRTLVLAAQALEVPTALPLVAPATPTSQTSQSGGSGGSGSSGGSSSGSGGFQNLTGFTFPGTRASSSELESLLNGGLSTNRFEYPAVAFYKVGQCAWSWLLALLAGWFAVWMYAKHERLHKS